MAEGAAAHGENNYKQGVDDAAFIRDRINHLIAHALQYANGDRSTDHLAAIRCNAGMLIWLEDARSHNGNERAQSGYEFAVVAEGDGYGVTVPDAEKMRR